MSKFFGTSKLRNIIRNFVKSKILGYHNSETSKLQNVGIPKSQNFRTSEFRNFGIVDYQNFGINGIKAIPNSEIDFGFSKIPLLGDYTFSLRKVDTNE